MKKLLIVCAFAILVAAPALASEAPKRPAPPERSPATLLTEIFSAQRPVNRTSSCEEEVYQDCLVSCWELSETNGCDFFASQTCLCWRYPVDCPVCY